MLSRREFHKAAIVAAAQAVLPATQPPAHVVVEVDDGDQHWYVARSLEEAVDHHFAGFDEVDREIWLSGARVFAADATLRYRDEDTGEVVEETAAQMAAESGPFAPVLVCSTCF
jgi:hypothetical protein